MASRTRTSRQSRFATIPGPNIQRSTFNRSHGHKTTMNEGVLVPISVDDVLPGDTMAMRTHHFGRIATLFEPIMDNVYLDTHWFFVPYRLVWDNWKQFMGEQLNPTDDITQYVMPTRVTGGGTGALEGSLEDYMGIPTRVPTLRFQNLPFRAYNLIWNEFFRDENLQDSVPVPKDDGPDTLIQFPVLPRGKRHDYFTASLPFAQKGDPVSIPLGGQAPVTLPSIDVEGVGNSPSFNNTAGQAYYLHLYDNSNEVFWDRTASTTSADDRAQWGLNSGLSTIAGTYGTADLSAVNAITVNLMRESVALQQFLEKDARGGSRLTEIIRSHFGVISPDARLQRPEYLGGSSQPLNVTAVANTAGGGTETQADLAAYGTIAGSGGGWRKSFTEHGVIIGLASVRADLNYQQGLERMWSRSSRYDFFWPTFQNLGEMAVLNKEIYAQGSDNPAADDEVWGYQERYAEYRYKPNRVSGQFRSTSPTSLDVWHLAQDFATQPVLDEAFIVEKPPIDRIVTVPSEPHFLLDFNFEYRCARPMAAYSVPGLRRF